MRTFVLAAAAAFSLLLPSAAFADEYNFTAPVRIENAVNVNAATVSCLVVFVEGGRVVNDRASTTVTLTDNAFVGNVAVRVTTVRPRASQTQWQCFLELAYVGVGWFPNDPSVVPDWYRNRSGHAVLSSTLLVEGGRLP
jgi:hypothetical protein